MKGVGSPPARRMAGSATPSSSGLQQDRLIGDDVPALFAYVIGCRTLARALNAKPGESEEWTVETPRELLQYAVENTHPQTKLRRLAAVCWRKPGPRAPAQVSHFANSCRTIERWNGKSPACRSGGAGG